MVDDELLIRGYIDRLDVAPDGALRVVDYKTGGAPREAFEARALFQLKFYALVLWRTRGVVPRVLRLLYLKDAEVCDYSPTPRSCCGSSARWWRSGRRSSRRPRRQDFRPRPSRLCDWCNHQALLPGVRRHPAAVPRSGPGGRSVARRPVPAGHPGRRRVAPAGPPAGGEALIREEEARFTVGDDRTARWAASVAV